ncbi:SAV_6107 family HEPN domain-containing protein [Corynebacterium sp.]|uniref:SAV_6107 family HEPN domain-containing protein n=1 Tax=Corynebacterium sp. TaxID=1720 RepID=UPI0026DB4A6B|nr:SAV_6107 family HEPN domain-containing protein [Corynebacterium sp.]MDO5031379.1 SAV_6107 family HEPN domain-containing protein [Corynebacterium sp.]
MAHVISATARGTRARSQGGARWARRDRFLVQARELLESARQEAASGRLEQALEMAYRAALRAAGACVAGSAVAGRRRLPTSAWDQLALVGAEEKRWAEKFEKYSRVRSRVGNGLDASVDPEVVYSLMGLTAEFIDLLEAEVTYGALAA